MMRFHHKHDFKDAKTARRVLAGVLFGISTLSLALTLILPPLSQAAANDAQTAQSQETEMGGGISAEPAESDDSDNNESAIDSNAASAAEDAVDEALADDNTSAKATADAENQNNADNAANADDSAVAAEQDATDTTAVALTAADGFVELKQDNIYTLLQQDKKAGKYRLAEDIVYASEITLGQGETVIDLNGHKIKHSGTETGKSPNMPLFNVGSGSSFLIEDTSQVSDAKSQQGGDKFGNCATIAYDTSGIPEKLTYYVTESSASGTATTETLYKHELEVKGAIVGTTKGSTMKLINVYAGGTFSLESGMLTQGKDCNVGNLVYAENGSTVNIEGGYVCGASTGTAGTGAGIMVATGKGSASILNISGGVIAGNYAPDGGGVYASGSTVNMTGGVISGNGTFGDRSGYGAGICALGSTVNVSDGYITNNKYQFYEDTDSTGWTHLGSGCHGGGGIAAYNGGNLAINGGYITGNYSAEAGGGVYAGSFNQALGSFTFAGGIIASNVAQNSEGGGVRIAAPTVGEFKVPAGTKAYITNNVTNTTNDWGGGGIFVQGGGTWGDAKQEVASAKLKIYNTQISGNSAQGYGGGFAACPSGKTAITDTEGIAIFDNTDENGLRLSGGTGGKNEDQPTNVPGGEITDSFKSAGHKDLFLIRKSGNSDYIAAVTGEMLGGGAANWSGTIDNNATTIKKNDGVQAKYMIGLASNPSDADKTAATTAATLFITGNSSYIHGGGIMTNGDVVAGSTTQVNVYPKMKLTGTKSLTGRDLKASEFEFELLKAGTDGTAPSFNESGELQLNGCSVVDSIKNDVNGNFTFDLGEAYASGNLVYYLVEKPGSDPDVTYDKTVYKIQPTVTKDEQKTHSVLDITYTYYKVDSVNVTKTTVDGASSTTTVAPSTSGDVTEITLASGSDKIFTNAYTKYDSTGSWTPSVTKVVEGGAMKEFTFELADNEDFTSAQEVKTVASDGKSQTLSFAELKYKLDDLEKSSDATGRGASKTFTYYVREKTDNASANPHYTYDQSVYKFTVVATDNSNGQIETNVTYTQIKDADGYPISEDKQTPTTFSDSSIPTFTNTYSTTLPSSGMSGVSLTYLAGAVALCAAAAWIHARRKADVKGGEHRE